MPDRRAEKSRGPCTIDGADAAGAIGVASLGSGLTRAGLAGVWTVGVQFVGACVVEVFVRGATSPLNGVTVHLGGGRLGLAGADAICLLGAGALGAARMGCRGVLGRKSLTLGDWTNQRVGVCCPVDPRVVGW